MALIKGKHIIADIDGVRCTLVESGLNEERAGFLKDLLVLNGYEIRLEKDKAKDGTELESYALGVTDILFNPMIAVYQKKLKRKDGAFVTPAYWNQWPGQDAIPYWQVIR